MYKILIADDEELELKSMRIFLERNYPEAVILPDAKNGTQVVENALKEQPDILILDIEMPGYAGMYIAGRMKEVLPRTIVVVVTA